MLFPKRSGRAVQSAAAAIVALAALCPPALAQIIDTGGHRSPIPAAASAHVTDIAEADRRTGQDLCGGIGIRVRPMTKAFADSLGMTTPYGAIFGRPRPGSPAAQAKIEAGDVITAINGAPLRSWRDFAPTLSGFAPGTSVYFRTYRDGQLIDRTVILGYSRCRRPRRKA